MLGKLFPPGGREDLAEVRTQVVTAAEDLPANSLAHAENARLQALLKLPLETIPGELTSAKYIAALSTMERGLGLAQSIAERNLNRFWEIKRSLDLDDDTPVPGDVQQAEAYNKNAQLASSMAALLARGIAGYLEHGGLAQRRAALVALKKSYARAIQMAGGAPVLRPGPKTSPLQMLATAHASNLARMISDAAKDEKDETLRAEVEATLVGFTSDAPTPPKEGTPK
jgi:hypothetical protein